MSKDTFYRSRISRIFHTFTLSFQRQEKFEKQPPPNTDIQQTETMSGKGTSSGSSSGGSGRTSSSSSGAGSAPQIVSGYEYHTYSQRSGGDRYVYIGKGDDGTPEFVDYGPKGGRR